MLFTVHRPQGEAVEIDLALPGVHNVQNALAALAIADKLGVVPEQLATGLASFEGIGRRFEQLGCLPCQGGFVILVDDYAHHPREISATLASVRGCWPDRELLVAVVGAQHGAMVVDDVAVGRGSAPQPAVVDRGVGQVP